MRRLALAAAALALLSVPASGSGEGCGCVWRPAAEGLLPGTNVLSLAVHPSKPATVYAGMIWRGIHLSTDGGVTWSSLSSSFPLLGEGVTRLPPDIPALTVHPDLPGTLYAATSFSGILKTVDSGASWSLENRGLDSVYPPTFNAPALFQTVSALVLDERKPETVYALMPGAGVQRSTDGGRTWSLLSADGLVDLDLRTLALDPVDAARLYVGTVGGGVFTSADGGRTWMEANDGLGNLLVTALAVDPIHTGTLYAGTLGGGVFRSVDGAQRWQAAGPGLGNLHVGAIVVAPSGAVYVGTLGAGVYGSLDGGRRWRELNRGLENRLVRALALDGRGSGALYAGTLGGGVFVLRDPTR